MTMRSSFPRSACSRRDFARMSVTLRRLDSSTKIGACWSSLDAAEIAARVRQALLGGFAARKAFMKFQGEGLCHLGPLLRPGLEQDRAVRRFERLETSGKLEKYIHPPGKIGVMVELVANKACDKTHEVARDVAMHIAAAEPRFLSRSEVTQKDLDMARKIDRAQESMG